MKFAKLYTVLACAAAVAGFTACSDVTDPQYHKPDADSFSLNTPAMASQYLELTEEGTFEIVAASQPDYGFSAVTNYRIDVALTPEFTDFRQLTPSNNGGTLARMVFKSSDLAANLCDLDGVKSKEDYVDMGVRKVYVRGVAFIDGIDDSYIVSKNYVTLEQVQGYFSIFTPGKIYVIGNTAGEGIEWSEPSEANEVALQVVALSEKEDQINSKIYYGTIDFGTNNPMFRFYTKLDGWDGSSYGPIEEEKNVDFEFDGSSTLTNVLVKGKSNFNFPQYKGALEFVVDMSKKPYTMQVAAATTNPAE